jgi:hypothetical protein
MQDRPHVAACRDAIVHYFNTVVRDALPTWLVSYVLDLVVIAPPASSAGVKELDPKKWQCSIIELNPFGSNMSSGSGLFSWKVSRSLFCDVSCVSDEQRSFCGFVCDELRRTVRSSMVLQSLQRIPSRFECCSNSSKPQHLSALPLRRPPPQPLLLSLLLLQPRLPPQCLQLHPLLRVPPNEVYPLFSLFLCV